MKTAVSLPDDLFKKMDRMAHKMGIPRSRLLAQALEEYIDRHRVDQLTEKLNEIHGSLQGKTNTGADTLETGIQTLANSLKNDSW